MTETAETAASLNDQIAAALRQAGLIDHDAIDRACRVAAHGHTRLDLTLRELGLLEDSDLAELLSDWLGLPHLTSFEIARLPPTGTDWDMAYLRRTGALPLRLAEGRLTLVMTDPLDDETANTIAFQHSVSVDRAVATPRLIEAALQDLDAGEAASTEEMAPGVAARDLERLRALANEGPIVRQVNTIVAAALDAGASDIHFEAQETELWVRLRVDGALRLHTTIPDGDKNAVISRLKVMAELNISERKLPQDGRIRIAVRGRDVDFRVSSLPTQHGESVVLRVLDQKRLALDWPSLGFAREMVARIEYLTSRPHGIFLVTGPTGSGKTTTLYTALSKLDIARQKVVTLEDPIEYALAGINQVQVEPEIGYTFATALRATLRQDPNVVMVGEVRDLETAENAIRAALMGRMVLSTVHTNSALGAIDRLIDFGVPPYLLASTLRGVLSQRLVRKICSSCAAPHTDPVAEAMLKESLRTALTGPAHLRLGAGCDSCDSTGFSGRMVIAELLEMTEFLQKTVSNWGDAAPHDIARKLPEFVPLKQAGLLAVASGQTTVSEIFQVVDIA